MASVLLGVKKALTDRIAGANLNAAALCLPATAAVIHTSDWVPLRGSTGLSLDGTHRDLGDPTSSACSDIMSVKSVSCTR